MDRRLKERLVGASILVAIFVLIVPELLSGPKRSGLPQASATGPVEPVRNVTVDLATSKTAPADEIPAAASAVSSPADTPPPVDAPPRSDALPAAPAMPAAAPGDMRFDQERRAALERSPAPGPPTIATLKAQQPASPTVENEATPPKSVVRQPVPREPAAVPTSHHGWAVQLGSFASSVNAQKLVRQLKAQDPSAYLSPTGRGGSLRYRVRIGPLADRNTAERVVSRLRKAGHSASLIPP